jgi:hypothetical protein
MPSNKTEPETPITIQDLYPELSPEQQREAAYYLERYLEIVRRIFERTQNLTSEGKPHTMRIPDHQ